jgi:hypothetical protein
MANVGGLNLRAGQTGNQEGDAPVVRATVGPHVEFLVAIDAVAAARSKDRVEGLIIHDCPG